VDGEGTLSDFGYCPLIGSDDKHVLGEFVNIIQHPEGDYKQVVLRENQLVTRLEKLLHYLADTNPGSSGSPVFNDQWEVIALHHWGGPTELVTPDGKPVRKDVNEGVRISKILSDLISKRNSIKESQRILLDAALNPQFRQPRIIVDEHLETRAISEAASGPSDSPYSIAQEVKSDGTVTWKIPDICA
jgi:endonuclease G